MGSLLERNASATYNIFSRGRCTFSMRLGEPETLLLGRSPQCKRSYYPSKGTDHEAGRHCRMGLCHSWCCLLGASECYQLPLLLGILVETSKPQVNADFPSTAGLESGFASCWTLFLFHGLGIRNVTLD
ncbi:hypothetical protein H6P81_013272 [Aristolochia fimbriata]|uniref:Uncharacterized protein n=1 Tax=Aristolochia fimbriata TaxID=158543 RepID=A0AAV7EFV0_ARIFI|nr:hypothetical protein H6P81_013272 [Aristolochia fimbriata]